MESDYDMDGDGKRDLVKAFIQVPRSAVEGSYKAATLYEARPYCAGVQADGYDHMKEVENKQAFYNNGIYFNWKIHLMVPRIKLLKRSWKMVCFFSESGILQPSVIVTASGVKLST